MDIQMYGKQLIRRTESKRYPGLFIKKYKKKVFFDSLWNEDPELLESRGHVELADGTCVIRPFTKIFNRFENNTDIDRDEQCVWVEKINGFMAAATYVKEVDDVVISTTGSLDSEYVDLARYYIHDQVRKYIHDHVIPGWTFLFEIVSPKDPHIIEEKEGAYLIGFRRVDDTTSYFSNDCTEVVLDGLATRMGVLRPNWGEARFSDIVTSNRLSSREGVVVYGQQSGTVLKLKSPYYLTLKMMARKKDIMSLSKQKIDEEFYPMVDHLLTIKDKFNIMEEQERLTYMREFLQNE